MAHPLSVVPLLQKLVDLEVAPAAVEQLFSVDWYMDQIGGKQEVMIRYSDSGKDASHLSSAWQLYKAQEEMVQVAKLHGVKLTMFHGWGGTVGRAAGRRTTLSGRSPGHHQCGSLCETVQGEVIEYSFGRGTSASVRCRPRSSTACTRWSRPSPSGVRSWARWPSSPPRSTAPSSSENRASSSASERYVITSHFFGDMHLL